MPTLGSSATIPLLFLAGVVASVSVAAWCAVTLLVLARHYLQTAAETAERAELGVRLAWMSALFVIARSDRLSDENYWEPIETYVSEHTEAQFSHRI